MRGVVQSIARLVNCWCMYFSLWVCMLVWGASSVWACTGALGNPGILLLYVVCVWHVAHAAEGMSVDSCTSRYVP